MADHVTAVRLNRPERLNAISFGFVGDLHDALDAVAADDDWFCSAFIGTGLTGTDAGSATCCPA